MENLDQPHSALLVRIAPNALTNPEQRESVSSWSIRLSRANGFMSCSQMLSQFRLPSPDLGRVDIGPSGHRAIGLLAALTGIQTSSPDSMHLQGYLGLFGADDERSGRPWVISAGSSPKSGLGARHAICVTCLNSDAEPYWRQCWRLATQIECPVHRTPLLGACEYCDAPLVLTGSREAPLHVCETCYRPFQHSRRRRTYRHEHERWLFRLAAQLEPEHLFVDVAMPAIWWSGIRALLALVARPRRARQMLSAELPKAHRACLTNMANGERRKFMETDLHGRRDQLRLAAWLVDQWPDRFVRTMKQAGLTATEFNNLDVPLPYWISSVVQAELARPRYELSAAEVTGALATLAPNQRAPSKIALKRLLGVTEAASLDDAIAPRATRITVTELGRVAALIQRQIGLARHARDERASWIRDAACMAVAAWSGQHFAAVCRAPLRDGSALAKSWNASASGFASDEKDLAEIFELFGQWMNDYATSVRSRFSTHDAPSDSLFLTRFGRRYGGSGLASRLAALLRDAGVSDWHRGVWLLAGINLQNHVATRLSTQKR